MRGRHSIRLFGDGASDVKPLFYSIIDSKIDVY